MGFKGDFELVGFVKFEKLVGDDFLKLVVIRFLRYHVGRFVKTKTMVGLRFFGNW